MKVPYQDEIDDALTPYYVEPASDVKEQYDQQPLSRLLANEPAEKNRWKKGKQAYPYMK